MIFRKADRGELFSLVAPKDESELPSAFLQARVAAKRGVGISRPLGKLDHAEACPRIAAATDLTDAYKRPQTKY